MRARAAWIMARIDKVQAARALIVCGVKQSHIAGAAGGGKEQAVQRTRQLLQRKTVGRSGRRKRLAAQKRMDHEGKQCCRKTLPGNVSHGHSDLPILQLHKVVVVAAHKAGRRSEEHTSELQSLAYLV